MLNGSLHKQEAAVLIAMSYKIHRLFKSLPSAGSKAVASSNGANKLNLPPTESLTAQQSPRLQGPWEEAARTRSPTKSSPKSSKMSSEFKPFVWLLETARDVCAAAMHLLRHLLSIFWDQLQLWWHIYRREMRRKEFHPAHILLTPTPAYGEGRM